MSGRPQDFLIGEGKVWFREKVTADYGLWQRCPICDGTGLVSRPPGVAGDQPTFVSTSCGPWPCRPCTGTGLLLRPLVSEP
jgi:hypothetical protein